VKSGRLSNNINTLNVKKLYVQPRFAVSSSIPF